jgi:hypothetical protein
MVNQEILEPKLHVLIVVYRVTSFNFVIITMRALVFKVIHIARNICHGASCSKSNTTEVFFGMKYCINYLETVTKIAQQHQKHNRVIAKKKSHCKCHCSYGHFYNDDQQ